MHLITVKEDLEDEIIEGKGIIRADTCCGAKFVGNLVTEHKIVERDSTRTFMDNKISPRIHNQDHKSLI